MRKLLFIVVFIILIIVFVFIFRNQIFTGLIVDEGYMTTKAVCNSSNFCQDYEIVCKNGNISQMKPITGAAVQHPSDWQDPRDEKKKKLCE